MKIHTTFNLLNHIYISSVFFYLIYYNFLRTIFYDPVNPILNITISTSSSSNSSQLKILITFHVFYHLYLSHIFSYFISYNIPRTTLFYPIISNFDHQYLCQFQIKSFQIEDPEYIKYPLLSIFFSYFLLFFFSQYAAYTGSLSADLHFSLQK